MERARTSNCLVKIAPPPRWQTGEAMEAAEKDSQDLLVGLKTKEGLQLERLEDVERLADIIHEYRVNGARSIQIAYAIIKFVKEGSV